MIDQGIHRLASELGMVLQGAGLMCVTAESCTGGLLAGALTACPGSSQWFERGFVTYSNTSKIELLRVSSDTLNRLGAVSEETAMEMAAGALTAVPRVQLAWSTTGIAGPGGASPGKPVGMVCFGLARRTTQGIVARAETQVFEGDRENIRWAAVRHALQSALNELQC